MPFIAELDGEDLVTPVTVTGDDALTCPACDAEMTVRDSHYRSEDVFVARHFVHDDEGADCPGESDAHLRMKAIAAAKLAEEYPDATVSLEEWVGDRQADILVEFPDARHPLGEGIAVEVQHRNRSKDRDATTGYYLAKAYSVLWLHGHHYRGRDVKIEHVIPVWPAAVKHADYTENYPDVIANATREPVMQRVPLPDRAARITAEERRDLRWHWLLGRINAARNRTEPPRDDGEWNEAVTERIGKHGELALLDTPDGAHVLQFRKVDAPYEDADLGIRLDERADLARLVDFALTVDVRFHEVERASGVGDWRELISRSLGGGTHRTRSIALSLDPDGVPAVKLRKKDPTVPDVPIRIEREDVETFFEFIAALAARSDPTAVRRAAQTGGRRDR